MAPADPTLEMFIEHRSELLKYAGRIVRDSAGAEDVVQEAWLRFSARSTQAARISRPRAYLFTIVRNLALNWVSRASTRRQVPLSPALSEILPADAPTADRVLYYRDELRVVTEAVVELPERSRRAFVMYRLDGLTLQEIADRLGISLVRTHQIIKEAGLHAARRLCGDTD